MVLCFTFLCDIFAWSDTWRLERLKHATQVENFGDMSATNGTERTH